MSKRLNLDMDYEYMKQDHTNVYNSDGRMKRCQFYNPQNVFVLNYNIHFVFMVKVKHFKTSYITRLTLDWFCIIKTLLNYIILIYLLTITSSVTEQIWRIVSPSQLTSFLFKLEWRVENFFHVFSLIFVWW